MAAITLAPTRANLRLRSNIEPPDSFPERSCEKAARVYGERTAPGNVNPLRGRKMLLL
jgi:hypothetical protein